ncbi:hypothetical protein FRC09_018264, partial [Ceratobasidium sp. 395]
IISTSLHPGIIKTELQRHMSLGGTGRSLLNALLSPTPYGALTQLYAGTAPEGAQLSGKVRFLRLTNWDDAFDVSQHLIPWARVDKARADTLDEEAGRKLWSWLEEQVKLN